MSFKLSHPNVNYIFKLDLENLQKQLRPRSDSLEIVFKNTPDGVRPEIANDLRTQSVNVYGVPASTVSTGATYVSSLTVTVPSSDSSPGTSYTLTYTGTRYLVDVYANGRWTAGASGMVPASGTGSAYAEAMPVHIGESVPVGTWIVVVQSILSGYEGAWPT